MLRIIPRCAYCKKLPNEINEYVEAAFEYGMSENEYVRKEEGTYNPVNGHFACSSCYVDIGMPTRPGRGWVAP